MNQEKNVMNYFNQIIKPKYSEVKDIHLIYPEIGKVKLIFKNEKTWIGRIYLFGDTDYKTITGQKRKRITAGIDIDDVF